jgi:hypothetical protein
MNTHFRTHLFLDISLLSYLENTMVDFLSKINKYIEKEQEE